MRGVFALNSALCATVLLVLAGSAGAAGESVRAAQVAVFPSSTTIRASAPLPARPAASISLAAAIGEQEDAMVVVRGAHDVGVVAPAAVGPLPLEVFFAHYVSFGGTLVPDALLPWGGVPRPVEQVNQPIWFRVTVPPGTAPGTYTDDVSVEVDGEAVTVPVSVQVFPVTLPAPGEVAGNLLTAFHVAPQTYGAAVGRLAGYTQSAQFQQISPTLYSFLARYRLSPSTWGYGAPNDRSGYTTHRKWWLDSTANMTAEMKGVSFAAMSIPISNNRTSPSNYVAGLSPNRPEEWCSFLRSVRSFWDRRGWLEGSFPYLYGMDEPGLAGFHVVARQAAVLHRCFPGGKAIVTGNPSTGNRFLWNGGADDVDVWVVLANRYYGTYTVPKLSRQGVSLAHEKKQLIDAVRRRGKAVWTYTYPNTQTPGFTATEPLSNPQLLFMWASLENIRGVLYGEGTTSYKGDPLQSVDRNGAFVLFYPGKDAPVPSARLEQIRDGIESWDILDIVRHRHGQAAVNRILGAAGLFSVKGSTVQLGCTIGCPLKTKTPFSWPTYSHDATTPSRLEDAKRRALAAAS